MLEELQGFSSEFLNSVLSFLPTSPFQIYIQSIKDLPYLSWLNWFVPVGQFIAIGQAWLISVASFYTYSIILRWLRAIE